MTTTDLDTIVREAAEEMARSHVFLHDARHSTNDAERTAVDLLRPHFARVVEECARVAEGTIIYRELDVLEDNIPAMRKSIAAAIRRMKESRDGR